jgi:hypothetical protein
MNTSSTPSNPHQVTFTTPPPPPSPPNNFAASSTEIAKGQPTATEQQAAIIPGE